MAVEGVHLDTQDHHEGLGGGWFPVQGSGTASVMNFQRSSPKRALESASKVGTYQYVYHAQSPALEGIVICDP